MNSRTNEFDLSQDEQTIAEALKLAGGFATPAVGRLLMLDARTMHWHDVKVPRDPECAVCAGRPPAPR